jgi:hypothetical protein
MTFLGRRGPVYQKEQGCRLVGTMSAAPAFQLATFLMQDPPRAASVRYCGSLKACPPNTAAQDAAIIGGSCKASWLKQQCREQRIPHPWIGGAYNSTRANIDEIIQLLRASRAPGSIRHGPRTEWTPAKRATAAQFPAAASAIIHIEPGSLVSAAPDRLRRTPTSHSRKFHYLRELTKDIKKRPNYVIQMLRVGVSNLGAVTAGMAGLSSVCEGGRPMNVDTGAPYSGSPTWEFDASLTVFAEVAQCQAAMPHCKGPVAGALAVVTHRHNSGHQATSFTSSCFSWLCRGLSRRRSAQRGDPS